MPDTVYTGTGSVGLSSYRFIKWVGKTKGGQSVSIIIPQAFSKSNPDWIFADKDDTVPEIEFEAVYTDPELLAGNRTEPWRVEFATNPTAGNGEILLGVGKFYVGATGEPYSASKTYAVNSVCVYNGLAYKCTTAINTAEAWNASHWTLLNPACVGLTRGGGSFVVEREYREITADGDPGAVEGRIHQEGGRPKLKLKALQWLTKIPTLYAGIE